MRLVIAGSRDVVDYSILKQCWSQYRYAKYVTEIVSGGARGVDSLAIRLANEIDIPVKVMKPDWDKYPRRAGFLRNADMAAYAHSVLAIWDYESPGTKHMIQISKDRGLYVEVYNAHGVRTSTSDGDSIATLKLAIP